MPAGDPTRAEAIDARTRGTDRIVVLQSFPVPRPTTNPYLVQLGRALSGEPGVEVLTFSWRRALFGRYDVFHVHWPEILVNGRTPLRKKVRQLLTRVLLARIRLRRIALVRTVHNVERPDGIGRAEHRLLDAIDRATSLRIRLSSETPLPTGPSAIIPHGHYIDWFAAWPARPIERGRIGYVGLLRRYKGIERLLDAFSQTTGRDDLRLAVSGRPSSLDIAREVSDAAARDGRIHADLRFLDDRELVEAVTRSRLIALPYRFMHNSGTVLAALSLGRPVLVPDTAVNRALSAEVGPGWVHTFGGELTPERLVAAHDAELPSVGPDLSARGWPEAARAHAEAYRTAMQASRR